jgi:hypothetical protein
LAKAVQCFVVSFPRKIVRNHDCDGDGNCDNLMMMVMIITMIVIMKMVMIIIMVVFVMMVALTCNNQHN